MNCTLLTNITNLVSSVKVGIVQLGFADIYGLLAHASTADLVRLQGEVSLAETRYNTLARRIVKGDYTCNPTAGGPHNAVFVVWGF